MKKNIYKILHLAQNYVDIERPIKLKILIVLFVIFKKLKSTWELVENN